MISDVKVAPMSPERSAVDPHSGSEEEALSLSILTFFFFWFLNFSTCFPLRRFGARRGGLLFEVEDAEVTLGARQLCVILSK